jgi:DNA-binding LacI/PurR family transcriptional regulator
MSTLPIAPTRLEDIAARVGVSRSEVSRVLNGRIREGKGVGAATRERILEVARELNYRPHRAAQNLARGRTDTVALMMVVNRQEHASPFHLDSHHELSAHSHEIIGGLTYALHQYGIHLLLAQCGGPDVDPVESMEQIARSRMCDGMIITDMYVDDKRPQILEESGLPFIVRGSSPKPGVVAVGMDNAAVGYQAIQYLYNLGHKRILFYNIGRDLMSGAGRYNGYCRAINEFGIEDFVEYRDDAHHENGVYNSLMERLQQPNRPTAIFAEDEIGALGAQRALADSGLRYPEDVSVMTCLNARFMRLVAPNLTVLNVRQNEVAEQVGHLMAKMLQGETVGARQTFLSPILEERGSTGPPPE